MYKCPTCDYLSTFRNNVVKHVIHTHIKQKQLACNQCDYRTGHAQKLKLHLMSHGGICPYKCSACKYQSNCTNKVTRHIKCVHANEVGISCEKLDLTFEVDAKQFQCEEKLSHHDIEVIELSTEHANALNKDKALRRSTELMMKGKTKGSKEIKIGTKERNQNFKVVKLSQEEAFVLMKKKRDEKIAVVMKSTKNLKTDSERLQSRLIKMDVPLRITCMDKIKK